MSRPEAREQARALRRSGASLATIQQAVGAARSSVSRWVKDIPLDDEHRRVLDHSNPVLNQRQLGQRTWSRNCLERRAAAQAHGRDLARTHDRLHEAGCMLYWAEGSKGRNSVNFTNSDADMIRFFLRFLRQCYGVTDDDVRL